LTEFGVPIFDATSSTEGDIVTPSLEFFLIESLSYKFTVSKGLITHLGETIGKLSEFDEKP
jgi:hypothetical protein